MNDFETMITSAEMAFEQNRATFERLGNYYLATMDKRVEQSLEKRGKSRIFFPVVNTKAKRILASFQEAYFSNEEFARLSPELEDSPEAEALCERLQKAANFYTTKKMKLFDNFDGIFLSAIVYGTALCKVMWGEGKPRIDRLNIDEVFFDPSARSFEDVRFVVETLYLTADDIARYQEEGIYKGDFNPYTLSQEARSFTPNRYSKIKLHDLYFSEGGKWYLTTLFERRTVIREPVELKDGLPIFAGYLIPQLYSLNDTGEMRVYGDSPIAAIVPLQDEMNARRNQQIDAVALQLNPKMLVGLGSGIDPLDLKRGAGAIIKANNPSGVVVLPPPNIQSAMLDVSRLDTEMQEAIGVTAYNSGTDQMQSLNGTATGISILSQEANTRIQAYIRALNETFIEPVFRHLCKLILKYGDERFFAGVDRYAPFEFAVSVNTGIGATNKQVQLNGLNQAFSMFMGIQDVENARKILKETLPLLGIKNTKEYFDEREQTGNPLPDGIQGVGANPTDPIQPQGFPLPASPEDDQLPPSEVLFGANQVD